jgi:hypothetical protein
LSGTFSPPEAKIPHAGWEYKPAAEEKVLHQIRRRVRGRDGKESYSGGDLDIGIGNQSHDPWRDFERKRCSRQQSLKKEHLGRSPAIPLICGLLASSAL